MTVFSEATVASEAKSLLIRGCVVRGVGWCIGSVHRDALERAIIDSRWLILSGSEGYVPYGRVVGPSLPDDEREDCPGRSDGVPDVMLEKAIVNPSGKRVALTAVSRAAFVGYAIRLAPHSWQRIGWDYESRDEEPVVLRVPQGAGTGDRQIAAVACLGYQQPARDGEELQMRRATLRETDKGLKVDRPKAAQPLAASPEAAAWDAGVARKDIPYSRGKVKMAPRAAA